MIHGVCLVATNHTIAGEVGGRAAVSAVTIPFRLRSTGFWIPIPTVNLVHFGRPYWRMAKYLSFRPVTCLNGRHETEPREFPSPLLPPMQSRSSALHRRSNANPRRILKPVSSADRRAALTRLRQRKTRNYVIFQSETGFSLFLYCYVDNWIDSLKSGLKKVKWANWFVLIYVSVLRN